MITKFANVPPSNLLSGNAFSAARTWLNRAKITSGKGPTGWPHIKGLSEKPGEWGTIDGIVGLLACGAAINDTRIDDAAQFLIGRQRDDGSWNSNGIAYSCAEVTAWVVIVLRQVLLGAERSASVNAAAIFLEGCISEQGGVRTSPKDGKDPIQASSQETH